MLKKAQKKLITQRYPTEELDLTERQPMRLLVKLKGRDVKALIHAVAASRTVVCRRTPVGDISILSQDVYKSFGPTLTADFQARKHDLQIGHEMVRQRMMTTGLRRGRKQRV